jgi:hypothetical protein
MPKGHQNEGKGKLGIEDCRRMDIALLLELKDSGKLLDMRGIANAGEVAAVRGRQNL